MKTRIGYTLVLAALGAGLSTQAPASAADGDVHAGRARVYEQLEPNSLEDATPPKALLAELKKANIAPSRIWKVLEHGEKIECLGCIPYVKKLLYSAQPKNREIGAWWLRRRVFGVFGPGEVYSQVVKVLEDGAETEERRAYAADAVGEFLNPAGVRYVAKAAAEDPSPRVRLSAVKALQRLNHQGPGLELGAALADAEVEVRLAALTAAGSINVFASVDRVVMLLGDESADVRKRAAETLGSMRVADSLVGLVALAGSDEESDDVRAAAIWALGQLGDPAGRDVVQSQAQSPSAIVRSAATIALRRL
jgi:hypothetical protein